MTEKEHSYSPAGTRMTDSVNPLAKAYWSLRLEARWLVSTNRVTRRLAAIDPKIQTGRIVGPKTEVCLEGYPRSANTFSIACLWDSNPDIRTARHIHQPGQVLGAIRLGIPAGILIRNPVDAVVSRMAFSGNTVSSDLLIRHWIRFYKPLLEPVKKDEALLFRFEDVIADPALVVRAFNERFDLDLALPTSTPEELFEQGGNRPSAKIFATAGDREIAKEIVEAQSRTARARELYEDLLPLATRAN